MTDEQDDLTVPTFTGGMINLLQPHPKDISIHDIAHGLSQWPRWNATARYHYSVAQHSVLVARILRDTHPKDVVLQGLLHDASEAYLADLSRPIKYHPMMERYREVEHILQTTIMQKFGVDPELHEATKKADDTTSHLEANVLLIRKPIWLSHTLVVKNNAYLHLVEKKQPERVKEEFLEMFLSLL